MSASQRTGASLGRPRGRMLATLAVVLVVALSLVGCGVLPFTDRSFERTIPAAIDDAHLGIGNPVATTSVDGFATTLLIEGDVTGPVSDDVLRSLVRIAVANDTFDVAYLGIILQTPGGNILDLDDQWMRLGATHLTGVGDLYWEDALQIARAR